MLSDTKDGDENTKSLASDFDPLLVAAMSHKVMPVQIKAERRPRVLKVVNKDGAVVGETTHGKALAAAARLAAIQTATQDGVRPESILCVDCNSSVEVKPGPLPSRCKSCTKKRRAKKEAERRKNEPNKTRDSAAKSRKRHKAEAQEKYRKDKAANPEKYREKNRLYLRKNQQANRDRVSAWKKQNAEKLRQQDLRRQEKKNATRRATSARKKAERLAAYAEQQATPFTKLGSNS